MPKRRQSAAFWQKPVTLKEFLTAGEYPYMMHSAYLGLPCLYSSDYGFEFPNHSETKANRATEYLQLNIESNLLLIGVLTVEYGEDAAKISILEDALCKPPKKRPPFPLETRFIAYDLYDIHKPELTYEQRLNALHGLVVKTKMQGVGVPMVTKVTSPTYFKGMYLNQRKKAGVFLRKPESLYLPGQPNPKVVQVEVDFTKVKVRSIEEDSTKLLVKCEHGNKVFAVPFEGLREIEMANILRNKSSYVEATVAYEGEVINSFVLELHGQSSIN